MTLHHYRGALLRNVWLKDGFVNHETKWGHGCTYEDVEGLFRAITLELCLSAHAITGEAVRFLRKRLEMTQEVLGGELGCSSQAIAKWEKSEISAVPIASARLLRLLALSRIAPNISLGQAIVSYDEPMPEKMVFSYSVEAGWHCAEHEHAPIPVRVTHNNVIDFIDALQNSGVSPRFDQRAFSVLSENEGVFAHASKLAAA